jgi:dihydroorotate dehydrogenase (NAD+) catalytic subunit
MTGTDDGCWDLPTTIGRTTLRNPVMPASGTYGYGLEYSAYGDPTLLGALVVKSLSARPWGGNPPPRLLPLSTGSMLNNVGLQNPGVEAWAEDTLPRLLAHGVTVVASIWGHTPDELLSAAELMSRVQGPTAWEINLSCPNLSTSDQLPSHNPDVAHELCRKIRSLADDSVGLWAKLAPHAPDVPAVAGACGDAAVDAVTVSNTYPVGLLDTDEALPRLGSNGGGVSGALLRPIARRLVAAVSKQLPSLPIVAAGGVLTVEDALWYLDNGATAVQVGTANFFDPRATHQIARGVVEQVLAALSAS